MWQIFKSAQGSIILRGKLRSSVTGNGLTGLTNASSGLIISTIADNEASATVYTVAASHIQTIATMGTYAAPSASNCRFKEVDATNHPGIYEIQIADARFAVTNAKSLLVSVSGATNLIDMDGLVPLWTGVDPAAGVIHNLAGSITPSSYTGIAMLGLGCNYVTVTGTTVTIGGVNCKDDYSFVQFYADQPAFQNSGQALANSVAGAQAQGTFFLWFSVSDNFWVLSTVLGTKGTNYFTSPAQIVSTQNGGPWTGTGTTVGVPTVTLGPDVYNAQGNVFGSVESVIEGVQGFVTGWQQDFNYSDPYVTAATATSVTFDLSGSFLVATPGNTLIINVQTGGVFLYVARTIVSIDDQGTDTPTVHIDPDHPFDTVPATDHSVYLVCTLVNNGFTTTTALKTQADLQTVKTQAVTCAAPITIGPFVGTTNLLAVDGSGKVAFNNTSIATVTSVTGSVGSIAAGGITVATFDKNSNAGIFGYLNISGTGTLGGVGCTDSYAFNALSGAIAIPAYKAQNVGNFFYWYSAADSAWILSTALAVKGTNYFQSANTRPDSALTGHGTTTGPPAVVLSQRWVDVNTMAGLPNAAALVSYAWDSSASGHTGGGTFGGLLNSAGGAGDPWVTFLPGSYTSGQAGNIVGLGIPAISTTALAILALENADLYIDTTTTPWDMVWMVRGSGGIGHGTELMRKAVKDTTGSDVTGDTQVPGSMVG